MKNRKVQYVVWLIGSLLVMGVSFALILTQTIRAQGSIGLGAYWIWTGFLLMIDWCPEWQKWDRWERQVYGLAFIWLGAAMVAISFLTRQPNVWLLLSLTFMPPALIALIGRGWYVNKKRSEEWKKQNQTEKD